jgi:hypothetical protein
VARRCGYQQQGDALVSNKLETIIKAILDSKGYEEIVDPNNPLFQGKKKFFKEPEPDASFIAAQFVRVAQAKDLASRLPDGHTKQALMKSSNTALAQIIDDWCGTPPRKYPWPWPGPPPWVWEVTSQLSLFANSLAAGSLRDEVLGIAGKLATGLAESGRGTM